MTHSKKAKIVSRVLRHSKKTKTPSPDHSTTFAHLYGLIGAIGAVPVVGQTLKDLGNAVPTWTPLTWAERLDLLLKLSIITMIAHAILWVLFQKILLNRDYSEGPTPKSWRAAVMSLSLTLPALTVPLIYQYATTKAVVSRNHFYGAILSVAGGALAYILLFGTNERASSGIRDALLHRFRKHPFWGEIFATIAYALILVMLIATPYRLLTLPDSPAYVYIGMPAKASVLTAVGLSSYILLMYPDSLKTRTHSGYLRGVMAGIFTVLSVCTALYA